MSTHNERGTMTEKPKQRRDKFCGGLTLKQGLDCASALLLPLMLGVFTVVITLHQTNLAQQQRLEDQQLLREQREQDLDNSRIQRDQDLNISEQQRFQDLDQAIKQRNLDKQIADNEHKLNREQRQHEMNIALTQYRDGLLTDYIREIGELLKQNNGSLIKDFVTKTLTRAKTLAVIRQLDPIRNVELIQFLYEAGQLSSGKSPLDLSTARLNNIDLNSDFNSNIFGLSLAGVDLFNASFTLSILSSVDFSRSNLTGAIFNSVSLKSCNFYRAHLDKTLFIHGAITSAEFRVTEINNSSFINITLNSVKFPETVFHNTIFTDAKLEGVDLSSTRSTNTSFTNTKLQSVYFSRALLIDSSFNNVHGLQISFTDTLMFNTRFENVNLTNSVFKCINNCHYSNLVFNNSVIQGNDFSWTVLNAITFINSDLSFGYFYKTSFSKALILNTTMRNSNCTNIDLTYARLVDSSFGNVIFINANVDSAIISGCNMSFVNFTGASLKNTWLTYSRLENTVFTDSSLNGANLSYADLFNAKINDTQLLSTISIRGARLPNGTYAKRDHNLITNGYADCNIPLTSSWKLDEANSVAVVRSKQNEDNCVFVPNKTNRLIRFYQVISKKYLEVRWDLKPVLVLSARFGGTSTRITIGYSGNIYSLNSTHKESIRFPLNYSVAMEVISVTVIFDPSSDDFISSWCDDIEVTVEVNDEP